MEKTYMDDIDRTIFPYVEYPGYPFRYPTHLPLVIEKKQADLLRRVSAALYAIFAKAVRRFQAQSDEFFDEMEIPKKMRRYLHEGNAMKDLPSWLSRFDYVMDQSGRIQMVEINADTPCAEIEAYYANGVAARYFFKEDPNEGEWDRLRNWMKDIFLRCSSGKSREELLAHPVLFSCFDDYVEDLGTTRFLMQAMQDAIDPSMRDAIVFESFYHLAVMEDGSLALPDGRTVSFLYRMHPMEILIEETADQDASSLGELLMDGYKAGKFHMMNPPESLIMQSKGFQALIYALMEKSPSFFTERRRKSSAPTFQRAISSVISDSGICPKTLYGSASPSGAARDAVSRSSMAAGSGSTRRKSTAMTMWWRGTAIRISSSAVSRSRRSSRRRMSASWKAM